jgi:hypothetical protein
MILYFCEHIVSRHYSTFESWILLSITISPDKLFTSEKQSEIPSFMRWMWVLFFCRVLYLFREYLGEFDQISATINHKKTSEDAKFWFRYDWPNILSWYFNILYYISESVVQRVSATAAAIYTPIGLALNIILLLLIGYCKNDDIKKYKM